MLSKGSCSDQGAPGQHIGHERSEDLAAYHAVMESAWSPVATTSSAAAASLPCIVLIVAIPSYMPFSHNIGPCISLTQSWNVSIPKGPSSASAHVNHLALPSPESKYESLRIRKWRKTRMNSPMSWGPSARLLRKGGVTIASWPIVLKHPPEAGFYRSTVGSWRAT